MHRLGLVASITLAMCAGATHGAQEVGAPGEFDVPHSKDSVLVRFKKDVDLDGVRAGLEKRFGGMIAPGAIDAPRLPGGRRGQGGEGLVAPLAPGFGADPALALIGEVGTAERVYHIVSNLVEIGIDGDVAGTLETLRASGLVEYAEPSYLYGTAVEPNDPEYALLYGLKNTGQSVLGQSGLPGVDINAEAAWEITTGDEDFLIAVIDGGTNPNHPDLAQNIFVNPGEIPGNGIDDDNNGFIDDVNGWDFFDDDNDTTNDSFHGTHVSGTIAAVGNNGEGVSGVMWRAKLIPLKFIGPATGDTADAIAAIQYAVDFGATVSNNSWGGGGFSMSLMDAIESSKSIGHIFVTSAGNSGANEASYPARYENDNIISVASINNQGQIAHNSQYNEVSVDLGAPGVRVLSVNTSGGYAYASGTSMASPHVCGVVGLVRSYLGAGATYDVVIDRVLSNTAPLASLEGKTVTGGMVDAAAALIDRPAIALQTSLPSAFNASTGYELLLEVTPGAEGIVPGSAKAVISATDSSVTQEIPLQSVSGTTYSVVIPEIACGESRLLRFEVEGQLLGAVSFPRFGEFTILFGEDSVPFEDGFEVSNGWVVDPDGTDTATTGQWERATPEATGAQALGAFEGSLSFVTGAVAGAGLGSFDVDDGVTTLLSPAFDLTGSDAAYISYARWFSNYAGAAPNEDALEIEISDDDGGSWSLVERVGPTGLGTTGGWIVHSFNALEFVSASSTVRLRFTVGDLGSGSIVEAAIDDVRVTKITCDTTAPVACNPADLNDAAAASPAFPNFGVPDGLLTPTDFSAFSFFFSTGDLRADVNDAAAASPAFPNFGVPDGILTPTDFSAFAAYFGAGCPCTLPGCP